MITFGRFCICRLQDKPPTQQDLLQMEKHIMAKLSTLGGTLATIEATLTKVKTEVETLKAQLGDVDIPADAQETLDRLQALSAALDDLNPDA